jgi:hypothetical protein
MAVRKVGIYAVRLVDELDVSRRIQERRPATHQAWVSNALPPTIHNSLLGGGSGMIAPSTQLVMSGGVKPQGGSNTSGGGKQVTMIANSAKSPGGAAGGQNRGGNSQLSKDTQGKGGFNSNFTFKKR